MEAIRVVFENYDDRNFGYLRLLVDPKQLRIEYHPASDGEAAKTPDDSVTVDLATRTIVRYQLPDQQQASASAAARPRSAQRHRPRKGA